MAHLTPVAPVRDLLMFLMQFSNLQRNTVLLSSWHIKMLTHTGQRIVVRVTCVVYLFDMESNTGAATYSFAL